MRKAMQLCFILLLLAICMMTPYAILTGSALPFGLPPLLPSNLAMIGLGVFVLFHSRRWEREHPELKSRWVTAVLVFATVLNLAFVIVAIVC